MILFLLNVCKPLASAFVPVSNLLTVDRVPRALTDMAHNAHKTPQGVHNLHMQNVFLISPFPSNKVK